MIKGFLDLPWFVWAGLSLIVAVVYTFVWPQKAAIEASGFRFFILRWGHALTWLLLAASFLLRSLSSWTGAANLMALAGGVFYALFLYGSFVMK